MKISFNKYKSGYRIVSLALDEYVRDDLMNDNLDFLFIKGGHVVLFPSGEELYTDNYCELSSENNYDVYEIRPDGSTYKCYDNSTIENFFFVTEACNSNCIMCPMPELIRMRGGSTRASILIEIARHMPSNVSHLTITGGEPFMIGEEIFEFFTFLQEKFERTEFLLLTNGRIFAVDRIARKARETLPVNTIIGIPVHGSCSEIHDYITQTRGSFIQTVTGIKKLLSLGVRIELRVVVSKLNLDDFDSLSKFIVRELPGIEYVSIMATEMTGNAYMNRDLVWEPYSNVFSIISDSVMSIIKAGIDVKLYNFPLCTVEKRFWPLCAKSISPDKIRYAEYCSKCSVIDACGGVFAGTFNMEKGDLKPIV